MSNPYLKRIEHKGATGHGNASEKRIIKKMGARGTPASGAVRGAKGDMTKTAGTLKLRMEAKSTKNDSMSVELGWLVKIATEALNTASTPAITLSFVTGEGKARMHGDWVAVPMHIFMEMIGDLSKASS